MRSINRSALVPYSPLQMYSIVNDVGRYPQFLPWCSGSEVLQESPIEMIASIEISASGVRQRFTTRNLLDSPNSITLLHQEGIFSSLNGRWDFVALGEDGCKVSLDLSFDMPRALMMMGVGRVFDRAADKMVEVFCDRASKLYG